ncbi:threonine ammonia-lyase [Hoeflea poritis]|uniref:Threonine/serine dehydratase n=1 Tax=Hoeflea poritis TaxID=2993659 RepID=A0ABT4VUB2_9HYPH|nr:threonine/serine dehydratase [Hoeflea poritis]MDA4847785.1 threonine/serine dehydratase [Hoeflea poritis]
MNTENVTIDLIEDAAERLTGLAVRTPLLESAQLNEALGMRLFFKPECLQRTGSFKFRGAYTKLSRIAPDKRKCGVVAYSSGNHAQGVAAAAQQLGMHATIVMPSDAPRIKIDNTRGYGADIVLYERHSEDRQAIAEEIAGRNGSIIVPPFDDIDIISGQGTVGLEIARQADYANIGVDEVLCPVGGGGLLSGVATALKSKLPMTRIWCAEPAGYDDVVRSLAAGSRIAIEPGAASICDAIVTPQPGSITFEIMKRLVSGGFAVSDHAVMNAVAALFDRLKLVVEPGGAAAFAALVQQRERFAGKTIVVVLSGGNVDRAAFSTYLDRADDLEGALTGQTQEP